jgi:hypothetical protein
MAYQWVPPSHLPRLLPALALLLLLLLKPNRCGQALWIAVPFALTLALAAAVVAALDMSGDAPEGNRRILQGLALGLAAVWLLSPYLQGRSRWRTFLKVLAALESFTLLSFVLGRDANQDGGSADMLIAVAVFALLFSVVLNLTGWSCRRRSGGLRLLLWLTGWIMAAMLALFAVMSVLAGVGPLGEMVNALLLATAITFGFLSPFLLLSFNNAFYRERLKGLLRLPDPLPNAPPLASPPSLPSP